MQGVFYLDHKNLSIEVLWLHLSAKERWNASPRILLSVLFAVFGGGTADGLAESFGKIAGAFKAAEASDLLHRGGIVFQVLLGLFDADLVQILHDRPSFFRFVGMAQVKAIHPKEVGNLPKGQRLGVSLLQQVQDLIRKAFFLSQQVGENFGNVGIARRGTLQHRAVSRGELQELPCFPIQKGRNPEAKIVPKPKLVEKGIRNREGAPGCIKMIAAVAVGNTGSHPDPLSAGKHEAFASDLIGAAALYHPKDLGVFIALGAVDLVLPKTVGKGVQDHGKPLVRVFVDLKKSHTNILTEMQNIFIDIQGFMQYNDITDQMLCKGIPTKNKMGKRRRRNVKLCVVMPCFFKKMDFCDAIRQVADLGYDAIETYGWKELDLDAVRKTLDETGVEMLSMCTTEFRLTDPAYRDAWVEGIRESCIAAEKLGVKRLITQVGKDTGAPREEQHASIVAGLRAGAPILEEYGVTVMIEPLNTYVNHPGYYLWQAAEAFEIVREVGHPNVKVVYDIYHQQVMEGNIIPSIVNNLECIAHLHGAGHPGRHEMQDGENDYKNIIRAVDAAGYTGALGLEYLPLLEPVESLKRAKEIYG